MALTLTPSPYQTVLDSDGNPVSGAKVNTYLAGTTTAASTYTTSVGDVANANPIVADSAGRFVAYLSAGLAYKFVITTSADVAVDEQDNVLAVPGSSVNLDITGTAGEAIAAGEVCYISATGDAAGTAGLWYLTDADAAYTSTTAVEIGIAVSAIAINTSGTIRLAGEATTATSVVVGTKYYVSATAGAITSSAPTNSRLVGIAPTTSSLILNANPLTLPIIVAQGGTGLTTLTSASVLVGAGTGTVTFVAPSTSGNVLTSNGSAWTSAAAATPESDLGICEGRLTLTSGTPVTTADVTGATSIYFTPYKGSRIALYDGSSAWNLRTFTEITIALGTLTDAKPYDLFAYDNSGTVTFDSPLVWTNSTTRATALTTQNGVLVKTGATTRRYIGTFFTTAATTTEDSMARRLVWNQNNRVRRPMRVLESTNSWTYTTATLRQANADTGNQLALVVGVAGPMLEVSTLAIASNSNGGKDGQTGVGEDSTSAQMTGVVGRYWSLPTTNIQVASVVRHCPAAGRHYYVWLEYSEASGTTTWRGYLSSLMQSGIYGSIEG